MSNPLRRRLERLEDAVGRLKASREMDEGRRAYWEHFYSAEQVEARDRERRQRDRDLLESNWASVGFPPFTPDELRRYRLEGTAWEG